jgi:hypothetical protein
LLGRGKGEERRLTNLIENEKLPSELGWVKQANVVGLGDVSRIAQIISNATSLITPSASVAAVKRRDLHGI